MPVSAVLTLTNLSLHLGISKFHTKGSTYQTVARHTTGINIILRAVYLIVVGASKTNNKPTNITAMLMKLNLNFVDFIADSSAVA